MFDFHKLDVYKKARVQHSRIEKLLTRIDHLNKRDQLLRASLSIQLNLAEGTGRFTRRDKRNFYIISRSSVFECVAILDVLIDNEIIKKKEYESFYKEYEEISKMIFAMINKLTN